MEMVGQVIRTIRTIRSIHSCPITSFDSNFLICDLGFTYCTIQISKYDV